MWSKFASFWQNLLCIIYINKGFFCTFLLADTNVICTQMLDIHQWHNQGGCLNTLNYWYFLKLCSPQQTRNFFCYRSRRRKSYNISVLRNPGYTTVRNALFYLHKSPKIKQKSQNTCNVNCQYSKENDIKISFRTYVLSYNLFSKKNCHLILKITPSLTISTTKKNVIFFFNLIIIH